MSQIHLNSTWVQCSGAECGKWRHLKDMFDPSVLPEIWLCEMNPDSAYNSCSAEEESYDSADDDPEYKQWIFCKFANGSVIWARWPSFGWWPGMVICEPSSNLAVSTGGKYDDTVREYFVVLFDCRRTHKWVKAEDIKSFTNWNPRKQKMDRSIAKTIHNLSKKELRTATLLASQAAGTDDIRERLLLFGVLQKRASNPKLNTTWAGKALANRDESSDESSVESDEEPEELGRERLLTSTPKPVSENVPPHREFVGLSVSQPLPRSPSPMPESPRPLSERNRSEGGSSPGAAIDSISSQISFGEPLASSTQAIEVSYSQEVPFDAISSQTSFSQPSTSSTQVSDSQVQCPTSSQSGRCVPFGATPSQTSLSEPLTSSTQSVEASISQEVPQASSQSSECVPSGANSSQASSSPPLPSFTQASNSQEVPSTSSLSGRRVPFGTTSSQSSFSQPLATSTQSLGVSNSQEVRPTSSLSDRRVPFETISSQTSFSQPLATSTQSHRVSESIQSRVRRAQAASQSSLQSSLAKMDDLFRPIRINFSDDSLPTSPKRARIEPLPTDSQFGLAEQTMATIDKMFGLVGPQTEKENSDDKENRAQSQPTESPSAADPVFKRPHVPMFKPSFPNKRFSK